MAIVPGMLGRLPLADPMLPRVAALADRWAEAPTTAEQWRTASTRINVARDGVICQGAVDLCWRRPSARRLRSVVALPSCGCQSRIDQEVHLGVSAGQGRSRGWQLRF